jgi:phospholipid-binding lipoprotein MlaA
MTISRTLTKKITMKKIATIGMACGVLMSMVGCSSQPEQTYATPQRTFPNIMKNPNPNGIVSVYDPIEPVNRVIYNFNYGFDKYVFLPVLSGYEYVTPNLVQTGVTNFFNNLREIPYFINNVLQFEFRDAGATASRFALNTTYGVLGFYDAATRMGIHTRKEDFGLTLAKWGVNNGPYLVLPLLGPSTLRDAGGSGFDYLTYNEAVTNGLLDLDDANKDGISIGLDALRAIDLRKNTSFRYYETGSPFEYELIRYGYIRLRGIEAEANLNE